MITGQTVPILSAIEHSVAKNFKLGTQIGHWEFQRKKCKIRSQGVVKGSRDLLLQFLDPLHISGTDQGRNFKFGTQISHWGT